jgi:hypothetical protein
MLTGVRSNETADITANYDSAGEASRKSSFIKSSHNREEKGSGADPSMKRTRRASHTEEQPKVSGNRVHSPSSTLWRGQ